MKAAKQENYNISHISTSTGLKCVEGKDRFVSSIIVDVFKSYQDPDHFVTFQVEHLCPLRMFQDFEINLN